MASLRSRPGHSHCHPPRRSTCWDTPLRTFRSISLRWLKVDLPTKYFSRPAITATAPTHLAELAQSLLRLDSRLHRRAVYGRWWLLLPMARPAPSPIASGILATAAPPTQPRFHLLTLTPAPEPTPSR